MIRPSFKRLINELKDLQGEDKLENFFKLDISGKCQKYSINPLLSPGPVTNYEVLARWTFSPSHVNNVNKPPPGELSDTAFEDIHSRGLSMQRVVCRWKISKLKINDLGFKTAGIVRNNSPNRKYLGVFKFTAKEIRDMHFSKFPNHLSVRIYDTPREEGNDYLHCEAMVKVNDTLTNKEGKELKLLVRTQLRNLAIERGIYKAPLISDKDFDLINLKLTIHDLDK